MSNKTNLKKFLSKSGAELNWEITNEKRGLIISRWKMGKDALVVWDHYFSGFFKLVINGDYLPLQNDPDNAIFMIDSLRHQN